MRSTFTLLGIEGGGTRTVAILADAAGKELRRVQIGPANARLLSDRELQRHFRNIAEAMNHRPSAVGIGLAGARTREDCARILKIATGVWPSVPCQVSNDLDTALLADEAPGQEVIARVLVLSGTGSCCYGMSVTGQTAKIGGWGHLLGDKGSGYEIGLRSLKAVVYYCDRDGKWPALGTRLLRVLQLNRPDDLIAWVQSATKQQIAQLAVEVFNAWAKRDPIASDIIQAAAASLSKDAVACARRLTPKNTRVRFLLAGSVLLKQPKFARQIADQIANGWPTCQVVPLKRESAWGAIELARRAVPPELQATDPYPHRLSAPPFGNAPSAQRSSRLQRVSKPAAADAFNPPESSGHLLPESTRLSPTEQRNPRSLNLHELSIRDAIKLMLDEEGRVAAAVAAEMDHIEQAVRWIVRAFRSGGRLFYLGAGTSGRLGVLDASECPPTFRTDPDQVQGIIAGGQQALWTAVEGAEDNRQAGAEAIRFRGVRAGDVVVGIAASGRTPFVWGALHAAKKLGARTILLCFNPYLAIPREIKPHLVITPEIGPEVLTGSTRLKAGTATKLILNIFTTIAMVRLGKVISNLMIDVHPSNVKLRDRAVRILQELTGCDPAAARDALVKSGWVIQKAWRRKRRSSLQ